MFDKLSMLGQVFICTISQKRPAIHTTFHQHATDQGEVNQLGGMGEEGIVECRERFGGYALAAQREWNKLYGECMDEIIMQRRHKVFCPWSHRFDSLPLRQELVLPKTYAVYAANGRMGDACLLFTRQDWN